MIHTETSGQAPGSAPAGVQGESSTLDVLIVLARHKRFIVRFTLGAAVLVAIICLFIPNRYTAATLLLPPSSTSMSSALLSQFGGASGGALASIAGAGLGVRNPGETYVSLFRSRTIEESVIQRFGLKGRYREKNMTNARLAFEDHSSVVLGVKDNLIRISVTDWDPKLAAEIANGWVDEYRKLSADLAVTEASQRRLFFEQQLLEARGNLTTAEEAMKQTQQSTGVLQIDSQARALIESAAMLRAQVVAKQVQISAMRSFATDDNPEMIMARQQLAALQGQVAKLGGTDQDSNSLIVPKGKVPEAGMEYIRKLRDVKYYETIYELLAKQFELAKLDEARQGAVIQVADLAVPPDKKSYPHRAIIIVLMTLIALVTAVLWSLASERWAESQRNPEKHSRVQTLRGLLFSKP